jgi:outer membrane protein assembly factor BamB
MVFWVTGYFPLVEGSPTLSVRLVGADAESGEIQWSQLLQRDEPPEDLLRTPVVKDGEVYAMDSIDDSYGVTVLDVASGETNRELDVGISDEIRDITVYDGMVFIVGQATSETGEEESSMAIYAVDKETGDEIWSISADIVWRVSIVDDTLLYFDIGTEEFVGRDISDGTEILRKSFDISGQSSSGHPSLSAPVGSEGTVYAAGNLNTLSLSMIASLVGFQPSSGNVEMTYDTSAVNNSQEDVVALYGHPLAVDGRVIVTGLANSSGGQSTERCFAISSDGEVDWAIDTGVSYAPVVAGNVVYLLTNDGIEAVSADGEQLDSIDIEAQAKSAEQVSVDLSNVQSPALGNGRLYVPTRSGIIAVE